MKSPTSDLLTDEQRSLRPILRLALPVLGEESLTLLVGYTDWWLVGHYLGTTEHKAAMGLMGYILWLLPSLFAAVAIGATALVARYVGSGRSGDGARVANQALLIGGVFALIVTALSFIGGTQFIAAMQLEAQAAGLADNYLDILTPAIFFIMIEQVAAASLRGAGDTVSGFLAKSLVNVVNIAVSSLLIIGPGPIPQLGWIGIAIGTAVGHVVGGIVLLSLLIAGRAGMKIKLRSLAPDREVMRRLLRVGLPGGLDVLAVLGCHLIYLAIINRLGSTAAAAHGLGVQIEAMAYLPGSAFQVAAATVSGQLLGAGRPDAARRGVLTTCWIGCGIMSIAAVCFFFAGKALAGFFSGFPLDEAGQTTASLLKIVAFSTPPLGVLQILTGGLRGAGDTRIPLLVTFAGLLVIRIPLAALLAYDEFVIPFLQISVTGFGWGVYGAWWAMAVDVIVRAALMAARFLQGGWKHIAV